MRAFLISVFTLAGLAVQSVLPASANAIWVDYQVAVSPVKQTEVINAFNKYKSTQTGRAFPGIMFLNAQENADRKMASIAEWTAATNYKESNTEVRIGGR